MGDAQWETCGAETLLEEFFAQDDLRQLAESAGKILDCPLLVLDDTFHVAAYRLPQGFSDELFQNVVSCGEITYEAGVLISRSPALSEGRADFLQLPGSPYPRRFALLVSAGVQLGCLICVDTDGHLEKIPAQTWELVERILAKQLFVEASRQDKPFETAEDILMHLLDGGFSSAAYFQLQAANTYLADFHPRTFALVDLTAYRSVYAGKRRLKEALEARLPDSHPFLYKGDVFLFLHEDEGAQAFDALAEEFHLIENAARTVYLPVGEGAALCEQLRSGHVTRTLLRKLGVYSVSCDKDQFDKLDAAGALELRPDGSAILTDTSCYSEKTGLAMDVETGIGLYF